ncbi:alpha-methylacyl-CoA racemase [Rubricella aquisinus]|uniref:Alpha-methylacyl-CoA racemase n=1 Tax=Rubricella aquisinus TaxID=2028108 RepID=A0A840X6H5_9RHOB|nr:CaiB/BaiF CoA-transferase family protein [Rubricella aquisinus]MBB5516307.1 alpha-methylacyl-CoA racemase [Rubricella aquisinus]
MPGPLDGLRVVEFCGLGPGPFCGMLLADLGADVVRIDRPGTDPKGALGHHVLGRGKRVVTLDLKADRAAALDLIAHADALIEGFRPGVMERLGLGPKDAHARNPALIYGRMTGWGQTGPRAQDAGHDINYIGLTGALHAIGEDGPVPPLNLLGDFGGGAMYLAVGILAALHEVRKTGRGQVIDAAIVDGTAHLSAMIWGMVGQGAWTAERQANTLDGGAHFYRCYECADGKWLSIGPIEPKFYALLREKAGLTDPAFDAQTDPAGWPNLRARCAAMFKTRSQAEWLALLDGTDACVAPVHDFDAALADPHMQARGVFQMGKDGPEPSAAPRFSHTPAEPSHPVAEATLGDILNGWSGS